MFFSASVFFSLETLLSANMNLVHNESKTDNNIMKATVIFFILVFISFFNF